MKIKDWLMLSWGLARFLAQEGSLRRACFTRVWNKWNKWNRILN